MRLTQRFLLGLSLIGALCGLFGTATPVFACSCAEATPAEQFDNATAIFVGTVKGISESGSQRSVDFAVSESRKGSVTENVTVTTGWGDDDCGVYFEADKEYVVYAYAGEQERLYTNICTGTSLLAADVQDGAGKNDVTNGSRTPIIEPDNKDDSIVPLAIIAIISFGAGTLVMYLVGRKNGST